MFKPQTAHTTLSLRAAFSRYPHSSVPPSGSSSRMLSSTPPPPTDESPAPPRPGFTNQIPPFLRAYPPPVTVLPDTVPPRSPASGRRPGGLVGMGGSGGVVSGANSESMPTPQKPRKPDHIGPRPGLGWAQLVEGSGDELPPGLEPRR